MVRKLIVIFVFAFAITLGQLISSFDVPRISKDSEPTWNLVAAQESPLSDLEREAERNALIAFYNSTNGNNWTTNTNWLSDTVDYCDWFGVTCDGNGRVIFLVLSNNQLGGSIPSELGNLSILRSINLKNNKLNDPIPSELGNLASLQTLLLSDNQLNGPIPSELGNLSGLQALDLSDNQLNGPIPSELGNLTNLVILILDHNQLSDSIPAELGNLNSLQLLQLDFNQLGGSIPKELKNLTSLTFLNLSTNDPSLCVSTPELLAFFQSLDFYRGPQELCVVVISIDIKPGSDPNSINCTNEKGVIPVSILATDDFDPTTVDHTTVSFEGASETHVDKETGEPRRHEEDVDDDDDVDLVFHFHLGDTGLTCDSTAGTLTGETFEGVSIEGTDTVRMVN